MNILNFGIMNKFLLILTIIFHLLIFQSCNYNKSDEIIYIIDTDLGIDDIRMLTILHDSIFKNVSAVIITDGSCSPTNGSVITQHILNSRNLCIPIGLGINKIEHPPFWRIDTEGLIDLFEMERDFATKNAQTLLEEIFNKSSNKSIVYIALGPLTNLNLYFKNNKEDVSKIKKLIYYGYLSQNEITSWNSLQDSVAAANIYKLDFQKLLFNEIEDQQFTYTKDFFGEINSNSIKAELIIDFHLNSLMKNYIKNGYVKAWDELIALYFSFPEMFEFSQMNNNTLKLTNWEKEQFATSFYKLIK